MRFSGQFSDIDLRPIGLKVRTRDFQSRNARFKSGMGHFILFKMIKIHMVKISSYDGKGYMADSKSAAERYKGSTPFMSTQLIILICSCRLMDRPPGYEPENKSSNLFRNIGSLKSMDSLIVVHTRLREYCVHMVK